MKVALVTQHYPPHFEGGTEMAVRAQAAAFKEQGLEVKIIAGSDRPHTGTDVEEHQVDGLPVSLLPRHESEFYDLLLERKRIRRAIVELSADADIVHLHHWSTLDRELVRTLSERLPVVVTLHDLFVTCPRFFREPQHGVERCPEPRSFETCVDCVAPDVPTIPRPSIHEGFRQRHDHFTAELQAAVLVIAPSQAHLDRVGTYVDLPADRTRVVPHGLAGPIHDAGGGTSLPFAPGQALKIGFFGHRARIKGAIDLAQASAGLSPADRERVELHYFGDAVEDAVDEEIRAAAAGVSVTFHGRYDLVDLPRRIREVGGLHLACQPSRAYESYGLVVDEAAAMALPVWVSDRGAPRERIGSAGRVLSAARPEAWSAALNEVLANPSVLERERASVPTEVRTAADAARDLTKLYTELLERAQ